MAWSKEIPVVTLNGLVATNDLPCPDIIKIDAEGLDLEVLEGASDFFGRTEVFMVEAAIVNKAFKNSVLEMVSLHGC
ncbi:MAG: FkbM family methyltransferase [Flavobacteriales bacterium]|nr:FkbM family methyltransferase [Flavobacteriales bacterium]